MIASRLLKQVSNSLDPFGEVSCCMSSYSVLLSNVLIILISIRLLESNIIKNYNSHWMLLKEKALSVSRRGKAGLDSIYFHQRHPQYYFLFPYLSVTFCFHTQYLCTSENKSITIRMEDTDLGPGQLGTVAAVKVLLTTTTLDTVLSPQRDRPT